MKTRMTILAICFIQTLAFAQNTSAEYENWESLNLKGEVKFILQKSFKANLVNSEIVKSVRGWQYDWEHDCEFSFDTRGNLISKKDLVGSQKNENYSVKLDDQQRIIEINRLFKTIRYEYDSTNKISSSKVINKQPAVISTGKEKPTAGTLTPIQYHYDANNLLIKKEEYKSNVLISVETFTYDKFNNLIICKIKEGTYIETHAYQYNEDNLLRKYEWSDNEEGMIEVTNMEYLNKIKVFEHWILYIDGERDGYIKEWFENGQLVKSIEADADDTITGSEISTYKFDQNGNWIQKTTAEDGKYFIVEREIQYY